MNKLYGGDCKDHAKAFVLEALMNTQKAIDSQRKLVVDPMLTSDAWKEASEELKAYRRFLRLKKSVRIVNFDRQYKKDDKDYFSPHLTKCGRKADLFLDPDNGIKSKPDNKNISDNDLNRLLIGDRIVIVFIHRPRAKTRTSFEEGLIKHWCTGPRFFCYLGQDTYFLCLSKEGEVRLQFFRASLEAALRPFLERQWRNTVSTMPRLRPKGCIRISVFEAIGRSGLR